ncbi:hypothetical protein SAMN04488564_1309 [Lentzea waywayandensis]|uniref:Uncharacterized protein n=1 Tax=Lentzea waywayandensis TaxID=84724 RepID=A0A1I6FJP8_9PSEU|nr:hypothetical protein SAMN04488564_1309 [Lentzea waywayandensis]
MSKHGRELVEACLCRYLSLVAAVLDVPLGLVALTCGQHGDGMSYLAGPSLSRAMINLTSLCGREQMLFHHLVLSVCSRCCS